ncbi:MAG: (2Fe-2S)-binding protein, partial [Alphaproteobacteria bacterium]|nr:(2Fe-2S)-binding protein [Alphaproteobacteria bacterium]
MTMRLHTGGLIDRARPLNFQFDGRAMTGFQGDSVASALMANDVNVIARSFKYHRPRGFFGAGSEEPNAIVTIGAGAYAEPNLVATQVPLRDGMVVTSQNRWPSLAWDIGALNGLIAPLLPSGFYYKTFMWPKWAWKYYEHVIRNAAGFGVSPDQSDPDTYNKRYRHCDVLVIGAGSAGLSAAREAARTGARVILCDDGVTPGGRLLDENTMIDGQSGNQWAVHVSDEMRSMPDVDLLYSTTVFGWYDHNYLLAVTRHGDAACADRQTVQKIRANKVVLATGAMERSLLFEGNDRPGIMLCSAARRYINRYGVKPGTRAVVYVNNDSGYGTLDALSVAGIEVSALIDRRAGSSAEARSIAVRHGVRILTESRIISTCWRRRVRAVGAFSLDPGGRPRKIPCDLVCV